MQTSFIDKKESLQQHLVQTRKVLHRNAVAGKTSQLKTILITSPSLRVQDNVSGISTLVTSILAHSEHSLLHFVLGSKDRSKKNILWALRQLVIYVRMLWVCLTQKFKIVHLNLGLEKFSIVRDTAILFLVKDIFRKKVLLHLHGGFYLMHKPQSKILNAFLNRFLHKADAVVVLSEVEKELLQKRYGNLSFHVLPNATDTGFVQGLKRSEKNKPLRFVFMGRINETKGIHTLTESFALLKDCYSQFCFHIYGEGPERKAWLSALEKIEGLQFVYHGVKDNEEKWEVLANADVFLLPALHSEGMPLAMLEAMAAGCVVIVNDVASIKTVVQHNVNGLLLSDHSAQTLAGQIKNILDKKLNCEVIGKNAQQTIAEKHSFSSYIETLDGIYTSLS